MGLHRLPNGNVTNDLNDEARMTNDKTMSKRIRCFRIVVTVLVITPSLTVASVKGGRPAKPNAYKAVRVHYSPLNKMIMSVRINGQRANLLVDTGASQVMLDADAASSFGIKPSQGGLGYIRLTKINGQELPVGFAQTVTAGNMSFGSVLVTLRNSSRSDGGNAHVDGVLGLDILTRYKAVINCRTKLIFFKVDQTRRVDLSSAASAENFTKIPLRREQNGALTVPCSIRGQPARLLVDTGAFVTTFTSAVLTSLGIALEPTHLSASFPGGTRRNVNAAKINDLRVGDFKVPPGKFGVTALPNFAPRQGSSRMFGILGMDTLYNCQAIIDLDSMNLFLK
jgi:predicted aspartyl protease